MAVAHDWLRLICETIPSGGGYGPLREGLGEAAEDLRPDSQFLQTLNDQKRPPDIRYHLGIGRKSYLTNEERQGAAREIDSLLARRGADAAKRKQIADFFQAEELRNESGDGAVSVRSASMSQVTSVEYFDRNHSQLIELPDNQPEQGANFQWIIRTMRWDSPKRTP